MTLGYSHCRHLFGSDFDATLPSAFKRQAAPLADVLTAVAKLNPKNLVRRVGGLKRFVGVLNLLE